MKNSKVLCLLAVAVILVASCAFKQNKVPVIKPFSSEMLAKVNGDTDEKPLVAKSQMPPGQQLDSDEIAELSEKIRVLQKGQNSLKRSSWDSETEIGRLKKDQALLKTGVEVNKAVIKQNKDAYALNGQRISSNTADFKQIKKAVNELSLMFLLRKYKKDQVVALRYRFAYGSSKLSIKTTKHLIELSAFERAGKIKVLLFEGYSDEGGNNYKNKKLANKRAKNGKTFYQSKIKSAALTAGNGAANFHGKKSDNRCLIVYVEIKSEDINLRQL